MANDADDVHHRWRDSLVRSAARAYRAASPLPTETRGFRWRLDSIPAIALAGTLIVALAVAWLALRPAGVPAPEVSVVTEGPSLAGVVVHVTGAVENPGVVTLEGGSRVADAVDAAGGLSADADQSAINLARIVRDGEQVDVPEIGEVGQGKVNLNRASPPELETLPGIGPVLAERIVADRESNGPFGSIEDLTRVSGIGEAVIVQIASLATV
jgi:competence protein ComEA